ncbi:calcineurin B-like protein [Cymbomonas tetramitiformis]|uniref:Calcineurin B-like protein n=1 Tax=Cymbomonas tetramitiformis TaxID=36881 RepID=A0AAE0LBV1_9CHLO|nr:calcineurin B-like protein [Cymbomonas tetramitiformis]
MLEAVIRENPDLKLPQEALEEVLEKTFREVDLAGDGHISFVEWKQLVQKNPSVINNMTLPALGNLTLSYPSFIFKTQNDGKETIVSPGLSSRV